MGLQRGVWLLLALVAAALLLLPSERVHTTQTEVKRVHRLKDVRGFLAQRTKNALYPVNEPGAWEAVDVVAPNVTDRETLLMLAHMATQAYYKIPAPIPNAPQWKWQEGLRGHIFATENNRTVVVALKGTSASFLPGGDTGGRDKDNDNLLFSCCCAAVSKAWTPVCGCAGADNQCDASCVGRALIEKSLYYPAATDMYNNISYFYPDSQLWITGHSLGGVLASFLGMTFGVPAIAFESPGDRLAASRLHLPLPPAEWSDEEAYAMAPVTHVYHTADSLATGQCQGPTSICSRTGFAMETKCHAGQSIVYDTVRYLGWSVGVLPHRITYVISELLSEDWDKRAARGGRGAPDDLGAVPRPGRESMCQDCSNWQFM